MQGSLIKRTSALFHRCNCHRQSIAHDRRFNLIVVLKGNKTNGAFYVQDFIDKGGELILTEQELPHLNVNQLIVQNTLTALQQIAQFHRKNLQSQ